MDVAGISKYFDDAYSELEILESKKDIRFWKKLAQLLDFDKERAVMVDDRESVLDAARGYGIKYLVLKSKASSRKPAAKSRNFLCVHHFDDVIS